MKLIRQYLSSGSVEYISRDFKRYKSINITEKGCGVARSKKAAGQLMESRSILKKISDYVVDHKGLFILFLGAVPFVLKLTVLFEILGQ